MITYALPMMKPPARATVVFATVYVLSTTGLLVASFLVDGVRDPKFGSAWQALSFAFQVLVVPSMLASVLGFMAAQRHLRRGDAGGARSFEPTGGAAAGVALVVAAGLLPLGWLGTMGAARVTGPMADWARFPEYFWALGGGALISTLVIHRITRASRRPPDRSAV